MQDLTLQHTIELIHDAARDAGSWAEVGQQLQQLLGLDGWHLMRMNRGGTEVLTAGGERVSTSAAERYDAHYGHIDPRLDLLRQAACRPASAQPTRSAAGHARDAATAAVPGHHGVHSHPAFPGLGASRPHADA